ncbi:MAG: hypothetical protein RQ842_07065, partial [Vulcanisaeta sp.]|nr:hypothetical protein [Vulcanisaeta sp.]
YRGTTNVKKLELVFSIRRGKFVKPLRREGDRVEGSYVYSLLPGKYVVIGCKYWSKEEPPYTVYAQLIVVDNECRVSYGKSMVVMFEHGDWLLSQALPQPLKDIYAWLPGYHSLPNPDFGKTYGEGDVGQLLKMVEGGARLAEGEEHE